MSFFDIFTQNILTPPILFFLLGIVAGLIKSDLNLPANISRYLSIYLMMAIGFKGGVAIATTDRIDLEVILALLFGLILGFVQPFLGYALLRWTTKLDSPTAAAVAAHYGSISMVTFATAAAFLKVNEISYAGYIIAVLALMEAPAILSGLFIAHKTAPETKSHEAETKKMLTHDIFTNGAIVLLFGAFIIGWLTGEPGMTKMEGFLVAPFQGILALFLLDMGLLVSKESRHLREFTWPLALFGIYMPLIGGACGLLIAKLIGMDIGTGTLFTVLCASASYIAVPAAMRMALPEAKASIYVPLSLAITFPFNVMLGIPLYYSLATKLLG